MHSCIKMQLNLCERFLANKGFEDRLETGPVDIVSDWTEFENVEISTKSSEMPFLALCQLRGLITKAPCTALGPAWPWALMMILYPTSALFQQLWCTIKKVFAWSAEFGHMMVLIAICMHILSKKQVPTSVHF